MIRHASKASRGNYTERGNAFFAPDTFACARAQHPLLYSLFHFAIVTLSPLHVGTSSRFSRRITFRAPSAISSFITCIAAFTRVSRRVVAARREGKRVRRRGLLKTRATPLPLKILRTDMKATNTLNFSLAFTSQERDSD